MRDLARGMHTGIGPPGADDRDRMPGEAADRRLHGRLHRWPVHLPLPADKGAAIIFEDELVAWHQVSRRWQNPKT